MCRCRSDRFGHVGRWAAWLGVVLGCAWPGAQADDAGASLVAFHSNRYGYKLSVPQSWRADQPPAGGTDVLTVRQPAPRGMTVTLTVRVSPCAPPVRPDQHDKVLDGLVQEVRKQVNTQLPGFRTESSKRMRLATGTRVARLDIVGQLKGRKIREVRILAVGTHYAYGFDFTVPTQRYAQMSAALDGITQSIWIPPAPLDPPAEAASLLTKREGTTARLYPRRRFGIRIPDTWKRIEHNQPGTPDVYGVEKGPGIRELTLTVTCRDWLRPVTAPDLPGYLRTTADEFRRLIPGCQILARSLLDIGQSGQAAVIEWRQEIRGMPVRMVQASAFLGNTMYSLSFAVPEASHDTYADVIQDVCESIRVW